MLRTFSIQTLGCKVNQYEGEQLAALLRAHGLSPAGSGDADLRVINSCSVTVQAASKSRQLARRATAPAGSRRVTLSQLPPPGRVAGDEGFGEIGEPHRIRQPSAPGPTPAGRPRVVLTGCWATSDPRAAAALPGVDAVIGHHEDVATELTRLLHAWQAGDPAPTPAAHPPPPTGGGHSQQQQEKGAGGGEFLTTANRPFPPPGVNEFPAGFAAGGEGQVALAPLATRPAGTTTLPLLGGRQTRRQRAYLKIQDGCDAHCTYCIIPKLRPGVWSKPIADAVEEARRLVAAGHVELVLTGIFLGAYGHPTALRRRQPTDPAGRTPLAQLIDALCTKVPGLRRLRLSSLEPGDLTDDLLAVLRAHAQVVPHFHLPLQSGSDVLLRRMNRQYTRGDFLRMIDRVRAAFDRPALTTDVIVGFPGETDAEFSRTLEVVEAAAFIHVHAFSYSPRPGTAAARWGKDFVRGPVVNDRINMLRGRAAAHSLAFRRQFVGQIAELLVEHDKEDVASPDGLRHGRSGRYFPVRFADPTARPGDFVRVRIDQATAGETSGTRVESPHAATIQS